MDLARRILLLLFLCVCLCTFHAEVDVTSPELPCNADPGYGRIRRDISGRGEKDPLKTLITTDVLVPNLTLQRRRRAIRFDLERLFCKHVKQPVIPEAQKIFKQMGKIGDINI